MISINDDYFHISNPKRDKRGRRFIKQKVCSFKKWGKGLKALAESDKCRVTVKNNEPYIV